MLPCMPASARGRRRVIESGQSQLRARPRHPQLLKRLPREITLAWTPSRPTLASAFAPRLLQGQMGWRRRVVPGGRAVGEWEGPAGKVGPRGRGDGMPPPAAWELPMLTDSRTVRTRSPSSPRRCASAAPPARVCR
eukprot:232616-Pleurochrysis_carterae.AAC.1